MSNDLNQCNFIGRLGKDPETRYTQSNTAVCNFSIAVSHSYKSADGTKTEHTEWVRVVVWGKLAEICGEYLTKGKQVYVSGRMATKKWQDQSGQDRYTTEIVASEMQMLGGRDGQAGDGQSQSPPSSAPDTGDDFEGGPIPF